MIKFQVITSDPAWKQYKDIKKIADKVFKVTLKKLQIKPKGTLEMSLTLANDDIVRVLNRNYRKKDQPTNVLSFPQETFDPNDLSLIDKMTYCHLGDIIISFETTMAEAVDQKKPFLEHFTHLFIHGILHLLGYDHENDSDAQIMEAIEIDLLDQFGIKSPYV